MDQNTENGIITHAAVVGAATSTIATGLAVIKAYRSRNSIPKEPRINRSQERENYINSILCSSDVHCIDQIRMSPHAFYELCYTLERRNLLQATIHMPVREQLLIFLHLLGHNVRFRVIGSRFYRSIETIYRYFLVVLDAILKLYPEVIRQPDSSTPTPLEIRQSQRFYPWFSDCLGAIDGTHIRASVPLECQGRFRSRKGTTTQNVLATVSFDLKFTYVLCGWEGSAHDSRVLNDALSRPMGLQVPKEIMSKKVEGKSKQFRWTRPMEHMLLEILANEVKIGNRPNNAFKVSSFNRVASAINEKYGVECLSSHVEHHLRTLKTTWSTIEGLRLSKTGLGWDDSLKMITASPSLYNEHVQRNPSHEKYLNKKIDMFDEMAIVVGKDRARGNFAKSFGDINLESRPQPESITLNLDDDIELEEIPKEKESGKQVSSSSTTSSQARQHRKRSRTTSTEDESLSKISDRLGEVAVALGKLTEDRLVVSNLYGEVMKMEDFDEEFLASAFDYLVQNEMLARAFLAKNNRLRKVWLDNFRKQLP